ncbi:hypothetical protein PVMG_05988 [Plasmodium vivax Mauritania I]|uniref:PIR Superfamily Protein n=1 Tax=Plasmodium vivax Mauritania I TaxID=1035515 RepID=A0A0J9VR43_PLAVI|nr:hypothetical protein PVMG_05988 [Plasmodium vivax Mauritania I]
MGSFKLAENNCPLSQFIKSLDETNRTGPTGFDDEFQSIEPTERESVLLFFSKVQENYSSISTYNENIRNQCCSYLNFWLNQKKKEKGTGELDFSDKAWEVVENLWYRLKGNNSFSCKRKRHEITMDYKKTSIDFMIYCVNRDELQKHCEKPDRNSHKDMYCSNFNDFTNKYYQEFKSKIECLKYSNKDIHYNWRFSDTCTLHNMAKTFPKYDTSSKKIVDDTSRNPINKCEDHEASGTIDCYMLDGVPVTLEELSTAINVIPLKYGIYASSSFLGYFSLGLYLYKVNKLLY